jgi:hypothetical protein
VTRSATGPPSKTEPIGTPAPDEHREPVAEPARLIAPSPIAEPPSPQIAGRPAAAAIRPASAASGKTKPKVAKVRFVPPPLHEDPEVAKFMAALNELPTVDVVEPAGEDDVETVHAEEPAAAAGVELELEVAPPIPPRESPAKADAPREAEPAPKTVKALKPARPRAISPAAAPPSLPASARKRVTPIRRNASAPAQPDPAPEAPPGAAEPLPAAASAPVKVVGRIQPAASAPAASAGARSAKQKSSRRPRPLQDEWGFFDPDQAGLPAVQAALEEIEEPDIFRNVSTPPKPRG